MDGRGGDATGGGDGEACVRGGKGSSWWDGVKVAIAIAVKHHASSLDIFDKKKPKASNSIE